MSMGDTLENNLLNLLFRATAIANVADNAASAPVTNTYMALHTADPGDAGTQATSEAAYTSYARVAMVRSTGWSAASAGSTSPAANVDFPAATGGSETETYASAGKSVSGATDLWFSGTITPNIVVSTGVTPRLTTASAITLD